MSYKKYGLTAEEYRIMLDKTDGACYICGAVPKTKANHIDHNHVTGKVRGILCLTCNRFLIGKMGDRINAVELFLAAAEYIRLNDDKSLPKVKRKVKRKRRRRTGKRKKSS